MSIKELPGKITITRPMDPRVEEEYISISVKDMVSHKEVVEVRVPLDNFSKALTGQGFIDCEIKYPSQENIGKKRETKYENVPCKDYLETEEEKREVLEPFEVDGWIGRSSDLNNHHRSTEDGYNVLFERWIEIENDV